MNSEFLPFALPYLDDAEINEVIDSLKSGWITTGPKCKQFEEKFAAYVGSKHAVAVNSATAGLHLALDAAGLQRGEVALTVPLTFTATAEVVRYFDADVDLIDVKSPCGTLDPALFEKYLAEKCEVKDGICFRKSDSKRVRAVLPVHFAGLVSEMEAISRLAKQYNLVVIEDAAHSFPAEYKKQKVGTISHLTVFSFYATKTITTGEGGMITTDDDDMAERMRIMRLHGISKDAWKRYTAEGSWYYEVIEPGFKYNLTDIAAAMGLHQLDKALWMRDIRQKYAQKYSAAFAAIPELQIPCHGSAGNQHAWHLYTLRIRPEKLNVSRADFIERLKDSGIGTSVHFIPLHLHPYYRDRYDYKLGDFPVSEDLYEREISLPIYPKMSEADVERVISAVLEIVNKYRK
ncbi:MAG: DegT/DnrJ/EryC1/StrS family aminotransferase [Candidatus Riflebacteria bacterium]|nr:DegT/DnrJ/EryC1/StrS family aminotransferase [Candidatus Riflebacteria bacterium]